MSFLNRLRGTNGLWSKVIGLLIAFIIYVTFHNIYVAFVSGIGYVIGESFGWGLWIGCLTVHRENVVNKIEDEGANNGIQWLSRKIIPDYLNNFINYCRIALTIRGLYWWLLVIIPLYFVGIHPVILLGCIVFLSIGFPIACEIGYRTAKLFSFEKYGFSVKGGWEHQEIWYGLMQDLVLIVLYISVSM